MVCVEPSPQATSTDHGLSMRPASLNPKSSVTVLPARQATAEFPPSVSVPTTGFALLTVTSVVGVLLSAWPSLTCTDTVEAVAGTRPSGNAQLNVPAFVT